MLPYWTLLIARFNFSNRRKTGNIIILHGNHRIIKNKKISHTLNKYFTDFTKTLKLKTIILLWKNSLWNICWNASITNLSIKFRTILMAKRKLHFVNLARPWKDWQLISLFKKHPWFGNYARSLGRSQETMWVRVLKLFFVKSLIQRIPLNHYMRFNLNDLKVLEH